MDATARGTWNGATREVTYQGIRLGTERVLCGDPAPSYGFFIFRGTIDPGTEEFQAQVGSTNWGSITPTVFRRIRCFDEGAHVQVGPPRLVPPPPMRPNARSGGCSCAAPGAR